MSTGRQHSMRRLFVVWIATVCVSAIWAIGRPALSAASGSDSAGLELRIVGPEPEAARIQLVLKRLLDEQGVHARFFVTQDISIKEVLKPPADPTSIVGRIFIDLREPDAITLYMSNARAQSFAFREVRIEQGKSELAREAAGAIVDGAVRLLLSGGSLELSREGAEQALQAAHARPPLGSAPPARAVRATAAAPARTFQPWGFYGASAQASSAKSIVHGPGLGLEVLPGSKLHSTYSLQYQLPATFEGAGASARLSTLAARAGIAWNVAGGTRSRLSLAACAGVNLTWLSPRELEPGTVTLGKSRWIAAPMLRPVLTWQYEMPGWGFGVMTFLDIDPVGTRYTVRRRETQVVAFEPWRARPGIAALVAW